ncbi:Ig-like domain-containing protein [Cellvibrio sp. NN19]|uniref:Ig-like domain-containing protein n=1 Tax=Cellvibrio chitinivorans TaxID=3102792 RepID=UPI002B40FB12|nr:Ig-like domain-containing protein [Cellvibrio sp. NN19]
MTGFTNADVSIANGSLSTVSSSDGGVTWTATFTPSSNTNAATNLVTVDNTGVTDAAGNAGTGTTDSNNFAINTRIPSVVSVVVADTALAVGETSLVTFTFSEAVTGFTNADLTIANGSLSAVSSSDGGITWTATFTPSASITSATNVITLDNTGVVNVAGNAGTGTTNSNSFAIDTSAPDAPSTPALSSASDSGSSNTDGITNVTAPTITGTAEAGSTVTLYDTDGVTVLGTTVATGGVWSITSSVLSEGSHSLSAKTTDVAGNQSTASTVLTITIDTTAPAKPTAPDLAAASDSGESATDNITNLTNLTVQGAVGSVEANAVIHARSSLDGGLTNVAANADGSWSLNVSGLVAGTHQLQIEQTDVAGNTSVYSDALTVVIDITAPVITSVAFDQSSLTNLNQSAVSLSLAGAETGTKATYSITSNNGGTAVGASGLAVSSVTQQFMGIDVSGLSDGTLTVSLTLVDVAGNASNSVTNSISKDTSVPSVSSVVIATGNYAAGDVISLTLTLDGDVVVTGTNSTLAINIGGVTRQAVFVSENAGVLLYQYTVQASDNTDTAGVIALANGITLNGDTVRDAGNNDASLIYAQVSNANTQVDTLVPDGVVVVSPADVVTANVDDYTINGTHGENGVTVKLYLDADNNGIPDNSLVLDSSTVINGLWELVAPLTPDSINNFVIVVEDAAGNVSTTADVPSITEDSTVPAAPSVPALSPVSDTGRSNSDGITSNKTPVFTGTAEPNSTITLISDIGGVVGTVVVDGSGNWSITANELGDGNHSLTVTATDAAGNVSTPSAAVQVTIDTQAPVLSTVANQFLGLGNTSNALPVTLSDNLSAPANLTLSANSSNLAVLPLANLLLSGVDANRAITLTSQGSGATTITLSLVDEAGNTGTASFTLSVNSAPVVSGTPTTSVEQDAPYSFTPVAMDVDAGTTLTYSITNKPNWASFNPTTGALTGTPTNADVGVTTGIVISVSDGIVSTSLPAFSLTVTNVNDAPTISGTPSTSVDQDVPYSFVPVATDVDAGTTLTYSIINKPGWASFDSATGALTGTPTNADVGVTTGIVISVSDGTMSASLPAFNLEVIRTVDPLQPIVTAPADITIDASALYTPITLRQLLSLNQSATQEQVDALLNSMASDGISGNQCCVTQPEGLNANNVLMLRPGRHEIKWSATNAADITGSAIQIVDVRPLVSLSKSQIAVRGSNVKFQVLLNGVSPQYPLSIPYQIDVATTAGSSEHNLMAGVATFTEGQVSFVVPVALTDLNGLGDSQLVVRLGDGINSGVANTHTISIREGNVPPVVNLSIVQGGITTSLITPTGGPVTVTAIVDDANLEDTHSFDWSATSGMADADSDPVNAVRVFDPSGLSGTKQLLVTVTDSAGASVQAFAYFRVVSSLPVLSADVDTDGDGFSDSLEGTGDADDNGIPDYLDNMPSSNILPQQGNTTNAYLIECDPGVRCGLGLFARSGVSGGVQVMDDELSTLDDLFVDPVFKPIGGVFDFAIRDLPTPGQSVRVVIPQRIAIPANAVYRKFQRGAWVTFIEDANNSIHSAPGNPGYCPPPGNAEWTSGLTEGHRCVQLTIEDGGPNDDDGLVNSAVVDPGAVSVALPEEPEEPEVPEVPEPKPPIEIKSTGGGGAIEVLWLLLLGGLMLFKRVKPVWITLAALVAASVNTQAAESKGFYLRADIAGVTSSVEKEDFSSALSTAGYDFNINRFDASRSGFQLALGLQWERHLYTELGYLDLGDVKVDLTLDGETDLGDFSQDFAASYPLSAEGLTLVQGIMLTPDAPIKISAEVGVFIWRNKIDIEEQVFAVDKDEGEDVLVGVKLDIPVDDKFGFGIGLRRIYFDDQTTNVFSLIGSYHF